jgi:hypothetical protein
MLKWLTVAVSVWLLLAPESARRTGLAIHRPFRQIDPPRAIFFRLIGLTWLFVFAWSIWTGTW